MRPEDVILMSVGGLTLDPATKIPIVILKDPENTVNLPIWTDKVEVFLERPYAIKSHGLKSLFHITVRATAEGYDPSAATVRDAMTEEYVCCFEDQQVIEAASLMEQHGVRRLPVLNRERQLSGVLSVDDIATRSGDDTLAGKILSGGMMARDRMELPQRARRA